MSNVTSKTKKIKNKFENTSPIFTFDRKTERHFICVYVTNIVSRVGEPKGINGELMSVTLTGDMNVVLIQ